MENLKVVACCASCHYNKGWAEAPECHLHVSKESVDYESIDYDIKNYNLCDQYVCEFCMSDDMEHPWVSTCIGE